VPSDVLSRAVLNRSLLARQGLLERVTLPALEMVEHLVGMQAQVPENPYVALWSRLADFRPEELGNLIAERRAVRAHAMRSTIHVMSARDCLAIQPITQPVLVRGFQSPWRKGLAGADPNEVAAAGMELLTAEPRTRAVLSELLAPCWPDADPAALAYAVSCHAALVQVPPRGLWGGSGQATWAPSAAWLDGDAGETTVDELILRYLAAFGPATVADARTWSGLTGLREVFERLRPRLRTFRDERGRELFDVPDAPFPDPDTPAPPRFLPEYDNVALSHDDRSRILHDEWPGQPTPGPRWVGSLLVDGFYRGRWRITLDDGAATLGIDGPGRVSDEIETEGLALLRLVAPGATDVRVELSPAAR
jgi:Winged helix DNA-binding domain